MTDQCCKTCANWQLIHPGNQDSAIGAIGRCEAPIPAPFDESPLLTAEGWGDGCKCWKLPPANLYDPPLTPKAVAQTIHSIYDVNLVDRQLVEAQALVLKYGDQRADVARTETMSDLADKYPE